MRARMALAHANITVELREILLSDRPQEIYDASPKGTVPVLQLNDGTVIDESAVSTGDCNISRRWVSCARGTGTYHDDGTCRGIVWSASA